MIETTKKPYEFLVRWGEDGVLRGAHVGFALVSVEDGKQVGWTPQPVMPVAIGGSKGFPLADILSALHVDAITAMDAAVAEKVAALTEKDSISAELTAERAKVAQLTAELAEK